MVKPIACYILTTKERIEFCKFLDGYAANLSRNVSLNDVKISGLKTHNFHVLFQKLLPVAIRSYLNKDVCTTIIELCSFFQQLCAKTLYVKDLEKLEEGIVLILCKLERIFPPIFFDIMVHLMVHFPHEAKLAGPVKYQWMYPFERYILIILFIIIIILLCNIMFSFKHIYLFENFIHRNLGTLKRYARNKALPEGSIVEAYTVNEALTFCSMYLTGIETRYAL